jgi:DegV family protein with EDD domain
MAGVRIVCDSTADLEADFRAAHDVRVVPLNVIFGEEVFEDGVTIHPADFYARMRSSTVHPRTSQPTPTEFEDVFRELSADGSPIVCTTISSEMSGSFASATQARTALPDRDIRVIDTLSVSVGHNAAVYAAIAAAEAGADPDAVVAAVKTVLDTQQILFTVETLEYLRRGGRIGGARALVGSMLDIKPILEIRGGVIEPVDRARTFGRALDRIVGTITDAAQKWGGANVIVGHADKAEVAAGLAARLRPVTERGELRIIDVGPVVGAHAGPGSIGIGFRPLALAASTN